MALRKTLATLRTLVRDALDEPTQSFWSEDQLTRYINIGKDRAWVEVKKLKDDFFVVSRTSTDGSLTLIGESYAASSFALAAGTREYTLPHDVSEIKLIECATSGYESVRFVFRDLASTEMRGARELTENQAPGVIYCDLVSERTLTIAPAVDVALDLRLWYVPILDDLSAETDVLQMPHPLYIAVRNFAASEALVQDRAEEASVWEQKGLASVQAFMSAHRRQTQDPELIVLYAAEEW